VGPWSDSSLAPLAAAGVIAGLWLLIRGLRSYRSTTLFAGIGSSRIESVAAGEVRISGIIEAAEMTLVSLVQSVPCVYYRASIRDDGESTGGLTEERAIGFRVRDATGSIRVFPRGARFDVPDRFDRSTDIMGDEPSGLALRRTASTAPVIADSAKARDAAIASLLTVHQPAEWTDLPGPADAHRRHRYREARLEPGDEVTVIGGAVPFSDLSDPGSADLMTDAVGLVDPEVEADVAAARAAGRLASDADAAWGNAAIPGFGIGRPVTAPHLDLAAHSLTLASPSEAALIARTFDIPAEALVLAASRDVPLSISFGTPGVVIARGQTAFLTGLLGAVLAIASAMAFAISVDGGFGR
jgi:hypothetical protein